jgi:hypothetical protein
MVPHPSNCGNTQPQRKRKKERNSNYQHYPLKRFRYRVISPLDIALCKYFFAKRFKKSFDYADRPHGDSYIARDARMNTRRETTCRLGRFLPAFASGGAALFADDALCALGNGGRFLLVRLADTPASGMKMPKN